MPFFISLNCDCLCCDNLTAKISIGKTGNTGPTNTPSHLHLEVIDLTTSALIKNGANLSDVVGQGRKNPRQYFANSPFASMFSTTVDSKDDVFDPINDTTIANELYSPNSETPSRSASLRSRSDSVSKMKNVALQKT